MSGMSKTEMIKTISRASDRYGDKLVDFMDAYGLRCLLDASERQLSEFIKAAKI